MSRLESEMAGVKAQFDTVRREREDGERRILNAINEHALASADTLGSVREDIGHLSGRLEEISGRRMPRRPPRRN